VRALFPSGLSIAHVHVLTKQQDMHSADQAVQIGLKNQQNNLGIYADIQLKYTHTKSRKRIPTKGHTAPALVTPSEGGFILKLHFCQHALSSAAFAAYTV